MLTISNYVGQSGPSVAEMVNPSTDPRASCSLWDAKAGQVCTSSLTGFPGPRTSLFDGDATRATVRPPVLSMSPHGRPYP